MKTLQLLSITDLHGFPSTENLLLLLCHNNFHCCLWSDKERLDAIRGHHESRKDLENHSDSCKTTQLQYLPLMNLSWTLRIAKSKEMAAESQRKH